MFRLRSSYIVVGDMNGTVIYGVFLRGRRDDDARSASAAVNRKD
jgi:hypothetical protein